MDLKEILIHDGATVQRREEIPTKVLVLPDGSYPVTQKTPLEVTVANRGDKVLDLKCAGQIQVTVPCARCLTEVPVTISIDFDERVDLNDPDEAKILPPVGEGGGESLDALEKTDYIHGSCLDVDRLVCGEALLNWPSQVLCSDDCKGLCRVCGQNLNLKTCDCKSADSDPRMAKIRDIFRLASLEE